MVLVIWGFVLLQVQRNEDKSTTLKLADFGLAKRVVRPIFTVCGTPTYVAPEILSEKGRCSPWLCGTLAPLLTNVLFLVLHILPFSIRSSQKSQRVGTKLALGF